MLSIGSKEIREGFPIINELNSYEFRPETRAKTILECHNRDSVYCASLMVSHDCDASQLEHLDGRVVDGDRFAEYGE